MNYKKIFLAIFLLIIIVSPIFYIYHKYNSQNQIGKQECDKVGFVYVGTFFKDKTETIFCQTERTENIAKLIKKDDKWERIS